MMRMLYAASLLNVHRNGTQAEIDEDVQRATRAIEAALRDEPDTVIDGEQFDVRFSALFNAVRDRLQPQLTRIREERVRAAQLAALNSAARRAEAMRLLTTERVTPNPTLLWVPFGVGQAINGQTGLAILFGAVESAALIGSIWTFVLHQNIDTTNGGTSDVNLFRNVQSIEILNYVSVGALVASVTTGIIQAHVAANTSRTVTRPLPPSLQNVQISLAPGAQGASLTFAF